MNAQTTAAGPDVAIRAFERAEGAYKSALDAFGSTDTAESREAVRLAREERELAAERLAIAEKKDRDAKAMATAKARTEKVARLSAIRAVLTAPAFASTVAPELARVTKVAAELAALSAELRARARALNEVQNEAAGIVRELGQDPATAPQVGYPEGLQWLFGLCARAADQAKSPVVSSTRAILDALGL